MRILQREPSPKTSATRDEQLRDVLGPPPLEVPRKVTVIVLVNISFGMYIAERKVEEQRVEDGQRNSLVAILARFICFEVGNLLTVRSIFWNVS